MVKATEKRKGEVYDQWRRFLDFWLAHLDLNMDEAVRVYLGLPAKK